MITLFSPQGYFCAIANMIINVTGQAQERIGKSELVIITERVDDVALLLAQMIKMDFAEILDHHIPRHWKQEGLSWGWTAVIWLAYILSEGDHRKVAMETYVSGMMATLSQITAQSIRVLDFSDDRLSHLLRHLSQAKSWHAIEHDLNERSIAVYNLPTDVIRCDATTVSAYHKIEEGGLVQFGHSKDDPSRPQIKIMMASLDPMGMPLVSNVLSGEQADDGLYLPLIERLEKGLNKPGLLFVGDCKMSAFDIRCHLSGHQHIYLSPLPLTGATAREMPKWIGQGIAKAKAMELESITKLNDKGEEVEIAQGYEFERQCEVKEEIGLRQWTERVLVIHSSAHAEKQLQGLGKRLSNAELKLWALTPTRGRGKRQITEESKLLEAISQVLKEHRVEGFLKVSYVKQTERQTTYVGRGRGSAKREQRVSEKGRYQITSVSREDDQLADLGTTLGWKAFVTNATATRLPLADAVLCYRQEYRIERIFGIFQIPVDSLLTETQRFAGCRQTNCSLLSGARESSRIFNRLKSRLQIAPLFVRHDEQIEGLTYLLTLGVRVLTVMEFVLRRSLQMDQAKLPGLHPENRKKGMDKPTAERVLKAFSKVSLTIIKDQAGIEIGRWLTPLSSVQQAIIQRLGLETALYTQLEIHNTKQGPRNPYKKSTCRLLPCE